MSKNAVGASLVSLACAALLIGCGTDDERTALTDPNPTTVATTVVEPTTTSVPESTSTSSTTSVPPAPPQTTAPPSTTAPTTIDGRMLLPWHEEAAFPAIGNPPQRRVEVDDAGCVRIGSEFGPPSVTLWPHGWSAILEEPVRIFDETGTLVWNAGEERLVTQFRSEDDRFLDLLPPDCRHDHVVLVGSVDPPPD